MLKCITEVKGLYMEPLQFKCLSLSFKLQVSMTHDQYLKGTYTTVRVDLILAQSKGALLLSALASETFQFAKEMQQ